MRRPLFTPEELEELRIFDAQVDAEPVTLAEYEALDFIEDLLFPEKKIDKVTEERKARAHAKYVRHREAYQAYNRAYYEKHKEEIAARKARWYQENKGRIHAQQREYRIRTGQLRTPEQRDADKLAHAEARRTKAKQVVQTPEQKEYQRQYQLAYRAKKKGMTVEEYVADQEAKKRARDAIAASATTQQERTKALQKAYQEAHKDELREYQREYRKTYRARKQQTQLVAAMA